MTDFLWYFVCLESFRNPTELDNIMVGLVVGRYGQATALSKPHCNIFVHEQDVPYDDITLREQVYTYQKPISLLNDLIEVYTFRGDWILAGPTGIGM